MGDDPAPRPEPEPVPAPESMQSPTSVVEASDNESPLPPEPPVVATPEPPVAARTRAASDKGPVARRKK